MAVNLIPVGAERELHIQHWVVGAASPKMGDNQRKEKNITGNAGCGTGAERLTV